MVKFLVLVNLIKIRLNKRIVHKGGARFRGFIRIKIDKNGKLILGKNVVIVSGMMLNILGKNICSAIRVDSNATLQIGNNAGISNTTLWAHNKVIIGDNVKIGADCLIFDSDGHSTDNLLRRSAKTDSAHSNSAPIIIEEDAFIGARCIITKGVTIGARSIVAAGSVVTKSIPSDEVWGGNPAKHIKMING